MPSFKGSLAASVGLLLVVAAQAEPGRDAMIASAISAGPPSVTDNARIQVMGGKVLREGSNGWTCYPGSEGSGPMCNRAQWDAVIAAWAERKPVQVKEFSISYMLAGEGDAAGVSNIDPFATEPTADNDWVKEGPHLMILVPDPSLLEGLSTNPEDPVYVMWKGTPYQHIMVKIEPEE